jgi:hypothetical protein
MAASLLDWEHLEREIQDELVGKLKNLYGHDSDVKAFNNLSIDKQQALLLVMNRMRKLDLWRTVRRIENVYGIGGVGINFSAWPMLASMLKRRKDFTSRFAVHKDCSGGFLEKGRKRAALHLLFIDNGERRWAVHLDLYGPIGTPLSMLQHLYYEAFQKVTPDWRIIASILADDQ